MKAADIADVMFLAGIAAGDRHQTDLECRFPDVPPKVLWAKRKALIKRGLMEGCDGLYCGCWAYELTAAGVDMLRG